MVFNDVLLDMSYQSSVCSSGESVHVTLTGHILCTCICCLCADNSIYGYSASLDDECAV